MSDSVPVEGWKNATVTQWPLSVGRRVQSLIWDGDALVDPAGGFHRWHVDGTEQSGGYATWYEKFDRALKGPGNLRLLLETLGTAAVLIDGTSQIRQVHRSVYHANDYEYPAAFWPVDENTVRIIHCPDEYNILHIDDVRTGHRLTSRSTKSIDMFHSRLCVDASNRYLMSAGWVWHPYNTLQLYDLETAIADPTHLDSRGLTMPYINAEVDSAAFLGDSVVVSTTEEEQLDDPDENVGPMALGVFRIGEQTWQNISVLNEPTGPMMPIDDQYVVAFHESPRVINVTSGEMVHRWHDIQCGKAIGPITRTPYPTISFAPNGSGFAVVERDRIVAVRF
jgi:hypothetical protein